MRSDISVLMRTARVHAQGRAQAQPHGATWDRRSGGRRRGGGLPGNPHAHIHAHPALRACAGRAMHMGQQPASMRAAISPALPAAKPGFLAALVSFGAHAHYRRASLATKLITMSAKLMSQICLLGVEGIVRASRRPC